MLSLQAWVGQTLVASKFESKVLELFAKVGGKYLGTLCLPTRFKEVGGDTVKVLMDLQEQAMNLMPHEWCDAQDVVFYVGATRIVPSGFDYKLTLTSEEAEQARLLLGSDQRIEMMWGDSSYNACFQEDGYENPCFDVFAFLRREARRASRQDGEHYMCESKFQSQHMGFRPSLHVKKTVPQGAYCIKDVFVKHPFAIWCVLADVPDGTLCTFSVDRVDVKLGTFKSGRALLADPFLWFCAMFSKVQYDAQVETTFLCTHVRIDVATWMFCNSKGAYHGKALNGVVEYKGDKCTLVRGHNNF